MNADSIICLSLFFFSSSDSTSQKGFLYDAQKGDTPDAAKPFKGVGRGVFEIVTRFDTDTYRTIYVVQIGKRVYVLHAFQKKSPRGRKTAKQDIELIKRRYIRALEMEEGLNT